MAPLTIELPTQRTQTVFNLRRWTELVADRDLAKIEGRIETDRYGRIILSLPFAPSHGSYQAMVGCLIGDLMPNGQVIIACPISTADGVKAADVAWASPECMRHLGNRACFPQAPEICVEVLSPSNIQAEIEEKTALYFDAGAKEVWVCSRSGSVRFYESGKNRARKSSHLCPEFPKQIKLP
jgi:Uma2 family endonuclease